MKDSFAKAAVDVAYLKLISQAPQVRKRPWQPNVFTHVKKLYTNEFSPKIIKNVNVCHG